MARIVLVNRYFHPDESATSQFATDLATHLAARHEVLVLTSRQRLEHAAAALPRRDRLQRVDIHRLWSTTLGRDGLAGRLLDYASFLVAVALWLIIHARRGDVVVAKTDPPLLGVVTTLATLGRGTRRVQWLQDLYPETAVRLGVVADAGWIARSARAMRNWSLRHSDLVVTVSAGMLELLRAHAGAGRLEHIPNWADDFGALPPAVGGDDVLTLGYAGNLGRAHPIDGLLQLAREAIEPHIRFIISGGGARHLALRQEVQRLGRQNWTFLPYEPRARVGALLRQADLHLVILDPRVEGCVFPSKVYGILSAGRPVLYLGDPQGEVAQLVQRHACGWVLPADAGGRLLALLRDLRAHPERLRAAGERARRAYESTYGRSAALARRDQCLSAPPGQTV